MPLRLFEAERRITEAIRRPTARYRYPLTRYPLVQPATSQPSLKVLIFLTDVEPAVRLNAQLERSGVDTAVVSPLDDVRGAIRRERPDVIVMTGALIDPQN